LTSIESISATGILHSPMLVLKAASLLERWIVDELSNDTMLVHSETGYSNDEINLEWLKHFERVTNKEVRGVYRLLILNSFSSHIEYDFVDYARRNFIVLFGLSSHTTHFL
jgi:DDE superfamily endonuclease